MSSPTGKLSVLLTPITPAAAMAYKAVRLRALQNSPWAFGSTYAEESLLTDAAWRERAVQRNGERSIAYLAWDGQQACGIVGSFLDADDPSAADLVSMWVAPTHRGRGVGRLLAVAAGDWARSRQAQTLRLMVTSCNHSAIAFYERLGFTKTGRTEPYPNDPALVEFEMALPLR